MLLLFRTKKSKCRKKWCSFQRNAHHYCPNWNKARSSPSPSMFKTRQLTPKGTSIYFLKMIVLYTFIATFAIEKIDVNPTTTTTVRSKKKKKKTSKLTSTGFLPSKAAMCSADHPFALCCCNAHARSPTGSVPRSLMQQHKVASTWPFMAA